MCLKKSNFLFVHAKSFNIKNTIEQLAQLCTMSISPDRFQHIVWVLPKYTEGHAQTAHIHKVDPEFVPSARSICRPDSVGEKPDTIFAYKPKVSLSIRDVTVAVCSAPRALRYFFQVFNFPNKIIYVITSKIRVSFKYVLSLLNRVYITYSPPPMKHEIFHLNKYATKKLWLNHRIYAEGTINNCIYNIL